MLDNELIEMTRGYVEALLAYCAKRSMALYDICWDAPIAFSTPCDPTEIVSTSHAIGVVCGIAAGLNVTPIELLCTLGYDPDAINIQAPPPVLAEGAVSGKRRRKRQVSPTVRSKR